MHPTTNGTSNVDTETNAYPNGRGNNLKLANRITSSSTPLSNSNGDSSGVLHFKESNGNCSDSHGNMTPQKRSLHNGINGNGSLINDSSGNSGGTIGSTCSSNNNENSDSMTIYQNGGRRDSTQAYTPLLAHNSNGIDSNNDSGIGSGETGLSDVTTVLYNTPSNNNEWKDSEEMNNLKNGFLHTPLSNLKHNYDYLHNHNNYNPQNHQSNNNGSLMNGKNGFGTADKYDEQDPLTGLYEHDFDAELISRNRNGGGGGHDRNGSGGSLNAIGVSIGHGANELGAREADKSQSCGLFGCRPKWARSLASTNCFMVVFLIAYILQGMYLTYFVSVITTIEKLFQIKSRTTGFLLSASEMGQISTAMLLTYFAGRGHRPRWIACGMVLFSLAAFACSLPHFIFGEQLMQSSAILNSRSDDAYASKSQILHASHGQLSNFRAFNASNAENERSALLSTLSRPDLNLCLLNSNSTGSSSECNEDRKLEQASHSKITVIVLCIFFASLLSSGIGQTAVATLGIPYIDDNVASQKSAGYIAITIGVRILGPASGLIVGSFCTRWYVNLTNPGFDASDPRWIGAWWLGPVIIGSLMMLSSIAMFSFPRQLHSKRDAISVTDKDTKSNGQANETDGFQSNASPTNTEPDEKPKLKDFPKTIRRQLSNDILMFRTASCVFHLLPIAGLYTFLPKYLETQFRLTTYDANMIAAFCGILVMGVGIVISGLVILKVKPSARSVAAWIAFTALVYSAGMFVLMFVGCHMNDFAGYDNQTSNSGAVALGAPACSAARNCSCDKEVFAPICGVDGKIYISSCHAGCMDWELRASDNRTVFTNCSCIPESLSTSAPYTAVSGYCDSNCKNFILFILIFAICVFMHSTSEVGSMLLVMRCTHPKDKAMALGIIQSAIGLFGNVPCPIIYGAVVDSACIIWKSVCGKHGACSLYDSDTFRHYFLGITSGIMFLAFIMDLIVWSKAHRIDIAPEDTNIIKNGNQNVKTKIETSDVTTVDPTTLTTDLETECRDSSKRPDTRV